MSKQNKIIHKIRKCLALSKSANEHESAIALRQAQKLMLEHGISDNEIQAHEANERNIRASASKKTCKLGSSFSQRN